MTYQITPKVAYIPLEYTLSVDEFLKVWKDMDMEEEPTQEDYDTFILERAKSFIIYNMREKFEPHIRLMEDN